ncbi:MAG: hypothetical protein VKP57_03290 [Candidatus Sericytochromatia bacterium]|nr:hypothetical protein [Candidatus Sericytochromatia bacterium]
MSERRRDPLSGQWVAVAGERGTRPRVLRLPPSPPPPPADTCPFCPGREEPDTGLWLEEGQAGWLARVVRNRYANLDPPGGVIDPPPSPDTLLQRHRLPGKAEVLVEGPDHHARIGWMPARHLEAAMRGQAARLGALAAMGFAHVALFRNQGALAGASQPHPHSQLVASWDEPPTVLAEKERFQDHHQRHGRCLLCAVIEAEEAGGRLVARWQGFVLLAPWAGSHPMELLLVPESCAATMSDVRVEDWAAIQARVDRLVEATSPSAATNLWVHQSLAGSGPFHWHAQVVPRPAVTGGWELATGWKLEPVPPEAAADLYRAAWDATAPVGRP